MDSCSQCECNINDRPVSVLSCGCVFHTDCILQQVIDRPECPRCETNLVTPDPPVDEIDEISKSRQRFRDLVFFLVLVVVLLIILLSVCFAIHMETKEKDTTIRYHPYSAIMFTDDGIYQCLNQTHCTMIESIRYNATVTCQFNRLGKTQQGLAMYPGRNEFYYYWPFKGVSPIELATVFLAHK